MSDDADADAGVAAGGAIAAGAETPSPSDSPLLAPKSYEKVLKMIYDEHDLLNVMFNEVLCRVGSKHGYNLSGWRGDQAGLSRHG